MEALLGAFRQWMVDTWILEPTRLGSFVDTSIEGLLDVDMHSVVSELTALRSEVRLEARATKSAREKLEQAASVYETGLERTGDRITSASARLESGVATTLEQLSRENDRLRAEAERAREEATNQSIQALFDLHDALTRGLKASEEARRRFPWRAKLLPRAILGGLVEGYLMGLSRISRLLEELEVAEIPCVGKPFDPTRMRSVEIRSPDDAEPGAVLDVVRAGFERRGKILRTAEVCTAAFKPEEQPGMAKETL